VRTKYSEELSFPTNEKQSMGHSFKYPMALETFLPESTEEVTFINGIRAIQNGIRLIFPLLTKESMSASAPMLTYTL
jgi:hypothetical protein